MQELSSVRENSTPGPKGYAFDDHVFDDQSWIGLSKDLLRPETKRFLMGAVFPFFPVLRLSHGVLGGFIWDCPVYHIESVNAWFIEEPVGLIDTAVYPRDDIWFFLSEEPFVGNPFGALLINFLMAFDP